jgi:Icc-related predicted phosphoesterase
MVRFLVVGDLHGRKPVIRDKNFDAIICIGDVCDDRKIKPYGKKWMDHIKKEKENVNGKKKPYEEFVTNLIGKKKYNSLCKQSLEGGHKILKYLNSFGKPVFFIPGNWDQSYGKTRIKNKDKNEYNYRKASYDYYLNGESNKKLLKGLKNVIDCQYKFNSFLNIDFIGYGLSSYPEDPSLIERKIDKKVKKRLKISYDKFLLKLGRLVRKRENPLIFLTHNVPYNTALDKITNKDSYAYGKHYGSTVARDFIIKYTPLICIGGHMHEHHGKCKLGKTTVINAGYGGKVNTYFDIENGKLKNLKFLR